MKKELLIIGIGGTGSYLAYSLMKIEPEATIYLQDGDILETANLDRQLFDPSAVGRNKAIAFATKYRRDFRGLVPVTSYYPAMVHPYKKEHLTAVFCCVDNYESRKIVLNSFNCPCIMPGNEFLTADCFYNTPDAPWYYKARPHIERGDFHDHPAAPCTGELQERHKQLVLANQTAALFAIQLYRQWLWDAEDEKRLPKYRAVYYSYSGWEFQQANSINFESFFPALPKEALNE